MVMAKTGKEAISYIHKNGMPAVILMDVVLPGVDGIETARTIRQLFEEPAPIIFLTALSDRETVERCKKVGAADYIVKPFRPSYLIGRIRVALGLERDA